MLCACIQFFVDRAGFGHFAHCLQFGLCCFCLTHFFSVMCVCAVGRHRTSSAGMQAWQILVVLVVVLCTSGLVWTFGWSVDNTLNSRAVPYRPVPPRRSAPAAPLTTTVFAPEHKILSLRRPELRPGHKHHTLDGPSDYDDDASEQSGGGGGGDFANAQSICRQLIATYKIQISQTTELTRLDDSMPAAAQTQWHSLLCEHRILPNDKSDLDPFICASIGNQYGVVWQSARLIACAVENIRRRVTFGMWCGFVFVMCFSVPVSHGVNSNQIPNCRSGGMRWAVTICIAV